ncbi:protein kinase domain protein [Ichthyophthirius multifiliis]|uniref:Protein kinase domain protein n=1 Tax=Ichthyophthirius multifiliis TaxID=5932 RepID=G0QNE4_ICHMU|nr:protein kinase domain protein [Ichthyophthirius multifiliis]EGR33277.1 protein kinase domain protein [Ichthyophthirius multifiliis]|eukprot:XP_004037263.1 protein kinase domain protein [Ichthyophthirius multifiliis]
MNKNHSQPNHKSLKCLKLVGQYVINMEQKLGEGSYGTVYMATLQTDQSKQYAVKVISSQIFKSSLHNFEMLKKEIEVLKKLRHENIVCLHEISQSSNNLYLFLDYCNGGDLSEYINSKLSKRLSESESIEFFKQFVDAYQYLYSQKIIHRDVKPENLMLHNGKLKLADFGFGRFIEGEMDLCQRMSIKCTPIYASPQLLKRVDYSSKCDIWSSACVFYKMLYGKYPFTAANQQQLLENIERKVNKQTFQFPLDPPISENVKQLIIQMLKFEESERISWEELFKHPVLIHNKKMNILNSLDENTEREGNPLYQSIIENRNNVEANDTVLKNSNNKTIQCTKQQKWIK